MTEKPISVGKLTLIPIVRLYSQRHNMTSSGWFTAGKETLGVIVCNEKTIFAVDVNSAALPIDTLFRLIPDLYDTLRACR